MNKRLLESLVVALLIGLAFLVGRGVEPVDAQDRNPTRGDQDPGGQGGGQSGDGNGDMLVYGEPTGGAMSANGVIAVTGSYGVGTSVLYVIDTESRQLAVYEARGGSSSMRRVVLVGARRIDLDLQLEGYNDESEFDYGALRRRFRGEERATQQRPPIGLPDRSGDGDGGR